MVLARLLRFHLSGINLVGSPGARLVCGGLGCRTTDMSETGSEGVTSVGFPTVAGTVELEGPVVHVSAGRSLGSVPEWPNGTVC